MGKRAKRVGGYRKVPLGARVLFDPDTATSEIVAAYRASGANMKATAEALGVAEQTLHRWVRTLGIVSQVEAMRARARREGWLKSARWPEKKE